MRTIAILFLAVVAGLFGAAIFNTANMTPVFEAFLGRTNNYAKCSGVTDEAEQYLCFGLPQQAAWLFAERGDAAKARAVLADMESVLRGKPVKVEKFNSGAAYSFKLHFKNGAIGLFKTYDSDRFCHDCTSAREVAAYKIDQWLGLNLVPLTIEYTADLSSVPRCVYALPKIRNSASGNDYSQCKNIKGSLQYWIESAYTAQNLGYDDSDKSQKLRLLDAILGSTDRHEKNWMISGKYQTIEVAIDNSRTFRHAKQFYTVNPIYQKVEYFTCWQRQLDKICNSPSATCSATTLKSYMDKYRSASEADIRTLLGPFTPAADVSSFLAVRPIIVSRFDHNLNLFNSPLPMDYCPDPPRKL